MHGKAPGPLTKNVSALGYRASRARHKERCREPGGGTAGSGCATGRKASGLACDFFITRAGAQGRRRDLSYRLAGRGLAFRMALEIERYCGADEILQGRRIDLVGFVDVDGAADIAVETGVE